MSLELYKRSARDLMTPDIPLEAREIYYELLKASVKELLSRRSVPTSSSDTPPPPEPPQEVSVAELLRQIAKLDAVVEARIEGESSDKYYLADQLVLLNGMTLRIEGMAPEDEPRITASLNRLRTKIGELKGQLIALILADDD